MTKRTTIRLVPPLQEELSKLAEEMGVSYNQLVNYALARFVESQKGLSVLEQRARRGSKESFAKTLQKVDEHLRRSGASIALDAEDELPSGYTRKALIAWLEARKRRSEETR